MGDYKDKKDDLIDKTEKKYNEESEFDVTYLSGLKTSCDQNKAINDLCNRINELSKKKERSIVWLSYSFMIVFLVLLPAEIIGLLKNQYIVSVLMVIIILLIGHFSKGILPSILDYRDQIQSVRTLKIEIIKDLTLSQIHEAQDHASKS